MHILSQDSNRIEWVTDVYFYSLPKVCCRNSSELLLGHSNKWWGTKPDRKPRILLVPAISCLWISCWDFVLQMYALCLMKLHNQLCFWSGYSAVVATNVFVKVGNTFQWGSDSIPQLLYNTVLNISQFLRWIPNMYRLLRKMTINGLFSI